MTMQLSDLKHEFASFLDAHDGGIPAVCKMGHLLFDEMKSFIDPILDDTEKFSIPTGERTYLWKNVRIVRDDTVPPYKFRFE